MNDAEGAATRLAGDGPSGRGLDQRGAGGEGAALGGGRALRIGLSVAVGLGCLVLVFQGVEAEAFATAVGSARPGWLLAGGGAFAAMHLLRALRWGALIRPVKPVPARSYVSICSIGFLLLNALPLRLGELARPILLFERERVPFGAAFATVVVERTLEILSVAALLALVVGFAEVPVGSVDLGGVPLVDVARATVALALVPFLGVILVSVALGERAPGLVRATVGRVHRGLGDRLAAFASSFVSSLRTLRSPALAGEVLAYTAATWICNVLSMWLIFRAFPALDLPALDGWAAALTLVVLVVGVMVPSGPAFIGTFELFCGKALALYGVRPADAAAYAVVLHAIQLFVLAVIGLGFLLRDPISFPRLLRSLERGAPREEP